MQRRSQPVTEAKFVIRISEAEGRRFVAAVEGRLPDIHPARAAVVGRGSERRIRPTAGCTALAYPAPAGQCVLRRLTERVRRPSRLRCVIGREGQEGRDREPDRTFPRQTPFPLQRPFSMTFVSAMPG